MAVSMSGNLLQARVCSRLRTRAVTSSRAVANINRNINRTGTPSGLLHRWAKPAIPGSRCSGARSRISPVRASGGDGDVDGKGDGGETKKLETRVNTKVNLKQADWGEVYDRFVKVAAPYWTTSDEAGSARLQLAGVIALTLATTGVSVGFNFLGRDFFNALSEKDAENFQRLLVTYLGAFVAGIPVFVLRDFYQQKLALKWREWMTRNTVDQYFDNRTFYQIQAGGLVDNPDQRINDDISNFTSTSLGFFIAILNSAVDLASFAGILYGIYPPLFGVLLLYSIGGTAISVTLGQSLVGLNFVQESREADFRYSLVRVRENAESIAFYRGEGNEKELLFNRFRALLDNNLSLLQTSRNLDFFTAFYRYLISVLPAAVVAPLYFRGEIEFGVINQSASAFNHILGDVSIVVFQFQAVAGFAAVVERIGEFKDVLDEQAATADGDVKPGDKKKITRDEGETKETEGAGETESKGEQGGSEAKALPRISLDELDGGVAGGGGALLSMDGVTLTTPDQRSTLIRELSLDVEEGDSLLIMGPSGSGKTSLLRAVAGLWRTGEGSIATPGASQMLDGAEGELTPGTFFVPQKPYMVQGTLRQQLLYPVWVECVPLEPGSEEAAEAEAQGKEICRPPPTDPELVAALKEVRLGQLVDRVGGLDALVEWSSVLSLGEQQRLAFARLLLARPRLALLDESTSALDADNELHLYGRLRSAGITYVSVGHRASLLDFHKDVLTINAGGEGVGSWVVEDVVESRATKAGSMDL